MIITAKDIIVVNIQEACITFFIEPTSKGDIQISEEQLKQMIKNGELTREELINIWTETVDEILKDI